MAGRVWTIASLACVGLICCGYVAYPCMTLYRLDEAVSRGDARALRKLIDWPEVRRGIEADLASDNGELPPFGSTFMRTIAVKEAMTPENVLTALHAVDVTEGAATRAPAPMSVSLRGAWAEGPCTVVVDLGTVRLRMQLSGGEWRVTRVWLPEDVLTRAREIARR